MSSSFGDRIQAVDPRQIFNYGTANAQYVRTEYRVVATPYSSSITNAENVVAMPKGRGEDCGQMNFQDESDEGLGEYQGLFRLVFDNIRLSRLGKASGNLVEGSRKLVNSVEALGLHLDDEKMYAGRLQFWKTFNTCWQALGQKQKDVTLEAFRTGRKPADMLSVERIKVLMDDLVGMCDQLQPYGLVDFEMGIWEEQIIDIFIEGLDLLCPRAVETQRKAHV